MYRGCSLLLLLTVVMLHGAPSLADDASAPDLVIATQLTITAIAVQGTNLVFTAVIPSNLNQIVLETHSSFDGTWEEAEQINVGDGANQVVFTIPKPATPTAFFRLKAVQNSQNTPLISSELQYVAMPSLGSSTADNGDAIFHFQASVDGSDKIVITREGALWNHVNWNWPPQPVTINGNQWNPKDKNYLTTVGNIFFLPEQFSLDNVDLEKIQGRDVIALERADNALILFLDDTQSGADTYDFKIHFHPVVQKKSSVTPSTVATLKLAGRIDGSDCIKFTATEATWEHRLYSYPSNVTLDGVAWNPQMESVRKNEGTNQFLPSGIDFSTAKIVSRKGRDLSTMWVDKNAMSVQFADNPNGSDDYEIEVSFGR